MDGDGHTKMCYYVIIIIIIIIKKYYVVIVKLLIDTSHKALIIITFKRIKNNTRTLSKNKIIRKHAPRKISPIKWYNIKAKYAIWEEY